MRLRTSLFLVVGLSYTLPLNAQGVTGSLIGVVRDVSRAVLPGTTVTVTSPAMPGGPVTVVTNEQGEYRLAALQPGIYKLAVVLTGFSTYEEPDLRVTSGGTTERNIALSLASVAETITVTGQSPVVDTRRAGIAQTQTLEAIEAVPLERRSATDYMSRLPGATTSSYNATNNAVIMGSPANEIAMTQDGTQYNNVKSGGTYPITDVDAVQEVTVTLLGASAEYQQAQGGVMNLVNKSGTNQFRGDGRYYYLLKGLTSTPFTLPCNCPEGQTAFKWYRNDDYSAHVGGPIVKDRLWYFGGGTKVSWQYRQPGEAAQPTDVTWFQRYDSRASGKLTWKINDKMSFTQTGLYEWWEYLNVFPSRITPIDATGWYPGDIRLLGSELTWTLNPSTVMTARYSYFFMPSSTIGNGPNVTKTDITTPARTDSFTGVNSGNRFAGATVELPRRHGLDVKFNKYISRDRSTHNVRFGVQFVDNYTNDHVVYSGGVRYTDVNGAPDQAEFRPASSYTGENKSVAVWVEDELNFGQRLTIQPGVRFDSMKGISPDAPVIDGTVLEKIGTPLAPFYAFREAGATTPGLGTMFTWNVASPRVGVNLKLTDDGRTVLRGTAGRFYRPAFISDLLDVVPGIASTTLRRYNPTTRAYDQLISVTDPRANIGVDPNIQAPWTNSYSFGIDREVARNMAFSVSYGYKKWGDYIGWVDTGGVYGTQTVSTPKGTLAVSPLLNSASARKFLRTNGQGFFGTYKGIITQLTKRMSNRWMASVGYTYSHSRKLAPTGTTGQDPNDLINLAGPLRTEDRPHVFNTQASFLIPRIDIQLATNLALASGQPYGSQVQVQLPQGRRTIFMEAPGSYRTPFQTYMMLRASKSIRYAGNRLELIAEIRNLLDEISDANVTSTVFSSPNFGVPTAWAWPRRMYLGARLFFR